MLDWDPFQDSKAGPISIAKIGWCSSVSIPPGSPDLKPIENVINLVKRQLSSDAIKGKISKESISDCGERNTNII